VHRLQQAQLLPGRLAAPAFDQFFVQKAGVQVTDQLARRADRAGFGRGGLGDFSADRLGGVPHFLESAVGGLVGRNVVAPQPLAVDVSEEIVLHANWVDRGHTCALPCK
jgi:hypothetical protein